MIDPSSTVPPPTDRAVVRGVVEDRSEEFLTLRIPGTDYRLRLALEKPLTKRVGEKIEGRIIAQACRLDVVGAGGRYIEPVEGRPRRVQGRILDIDAAQRAVVINAGAPIALQLDERQKPEDFQPDQLVTTSVRSGAKFIPTA